MNVELQCVIAASFAMSVLSAWLTRSATRRLRHVRAIYEQHLRDLAELSVDCSRTLFRDGHDEMATKFESMASRLERIAAIGDDDSE